MCAGAGGREATLDSQGGREEQRSEREKEEEAVHSTVGGLA